MRIFSYLNLGLALCAVAFFAACGKGNKAVGNLVAYAPENAAAVMYISADQIWNQKLDKSKLKALEDFKTVFALSPEAEKFFDNPSELGIDLKKGILGYAEFKSKDDVSMGLYMGMGDVAKLNSLIEKSGSKEMVKTAGDVNYVLFPSPMGNICLAWNKSLMAIRVGKDVTEEGAKTALNPPAKSLSDANGLAALNSGKDLVFWVNMGQLAKMSPELGAGLAALGLSQSNLEQGNYLSITGDFQKGAAESRMAFSFNDAISKEFGPLFKSKMDFNPADYLAGDPVFTTSFAFDFAGVYAMLEKRGVTGLIENQAKSMGVSVKEMMEMLSGDIALGVYNGSPFNISLALGLKKADAGPKLMSLAQEQMKANGGGAMASEVKDNRMSVKLPDSPMPLEVVATDKALFFSTDKAAAEKAGKMGTKYEAIEAMPKHFMTLYINYDQVLSMSKSTGADMGLSNDPMLSVLESQFTTLGPNELLSVQKLKDKNANALTTLILAAIEEAKRPTKFDFNDDFNTEEDDDLFN